MTYIELISQALTLSGKGYEGQIAEGQTLKTALSKLSGILGDWENEELGTWKESEQAFCLTVGKNKYSVGTGLEIDFARPLSIVDLETKQIPGAVTYKGETTVAVFLALTTATLGDYYQFTDANSTISIGEFGVLNKNISALITSSDYDLQDDSAVYIPLDEYMSYDFEELPNKFGNGTPLIFHYKPGIESGELFLWKTGNVGQHLKFTIYTGFTEVTTANVTGNLDFPKSWRRCLEYSLAYELGLFYSAPPDKIALLSAQADKFLESAMGSNKTEGSVIFYASTD